MAAIAREISERCHSSVTLSGSAANEAQGPARSGVRATNLKTRTHEKQKTRPGGQPDGSSHIGAWGGWALAPDIAWEGFPAPTSGLSPAPRRTFKLPVDFFGRSRKRGALPLLPCGLKHRGPCIAHESGRNSCCIQLIGSVSSWRGTSAPAREMGRSGMT